MDVPALPNHNLTGTSQRPIELSKQEHTNYYTSCIDSVLDGDKGVLVIKLGAFDTMHLRVCNSLEINDVR
jgi:hypothetical protein